MVTQNLPFGKPSPRAIPEEYFTGWPMESELFCAYMHFATLELTCDPQFHAAVFLATMSMEFCRRGFKTKHGPHLPLWFCLVGGRYTGKTLALEMGLQTLRSSWAMYDLKFQGDPPLVHCDGSVPGLLALLHKHYSIQNHTTSGLLYSDHLTRVFRDRDPIYPVLSTLADGNTYTVHTREMQKTRGQKSRRPGDGIPDQIINPRISSVFNTSLEAASEILGTAVLSSGFLTRNLIVYGEQMSQEYRRNYVEGRYDKEHEDYLDSLEQHLVKLDVLVPSKQVTYTSAVLDIGDQLEQEAVGDNAIQLQSIKQHAMRVAGNYALLLCEPEVTPEIFWTAHTYVTQRYEGTRVIEKRIGASEAAAMADRTEQLLIKAGKRGIYRSDLSRRLKCSSKMLDEVVQVLRDRSAVAVSRDPNRDNTIVYHEPTCAPDGLISEAGFGFQYGKNGIN